MSLNNYDIRNPELRKLVHDAGEVNAELILKVIVVVDNALNVVQRERGNDLATTLKRIIDVENSLNSMRQEQMHEREERNKLELERAERDAASARRRLGLTTDAKLEVQKIFEENLQKELDEQLDVKQEETRKANAKWWKETTQAILRAVLIAIAVPVALGIVAAIILFLAQVFKVAL